MRLELRMLRVSSLSTQLDSFSSISSSGRSKQLEPACDAKLMFFRPPRPGWTPPGRERRRDARDGEVRVVPEVG